MLLSQPEMHRRQQLPPGVQDDFEQPVAAFPYSHLHLIFGDGEGKSLQRDVDRFDDPEHAADLTDAFIDEIAEYLNMDEEAYRLPHTRQSATQRRLSAAQLAQSLREVNTVDGESPDISESVLLCIALQLLASCFTVLPASSVAASPIEQRRLRPTTVSSLKLHSRYRFSPAAGHHARECSENFPWPALYDGPSLEDSLAERISSRRRLHLYTHQTSPSTCDGSQTDLTEQQTLLQDTVPCPMSCQESSRMEVVADDVQKSSEWVDRSSRPELRILRLPDSPPFSNSSKEKSPGFFTKLWCRPSLSCRQNPQTSLFSRFSFTSSNKSITATRPQLKSPASFTNLKNPGISTKRQIPNVPSRHRLRCTQSDTGITHPNQTSRLTSEAMSPHSSSNPTLASSPYDTRVIPEIRFQSATTIGQSSAWVCGRNELLCSTIFDESCLSPSRFPWSALVSPNSTQDPLLPFDYLDDSNLHCTYDYRTHRIICVSDSPSPRHSSWSSTKKSSDYFGKATFESQVTESAASSGGWRGWVGREMQEEGEDSDDSVDVKAKRKDTLSRGGGGLGARFARRSRGDGTDEGEEDDCGGASGWREEGGFVEE
ncbi:hypothetical protein B0J11DRAFT_79601 [Dendryphion nanum]|uniref:Uncharacterized protein n=1 Tax=Dendryphion nanum TaxID=256645 RepID=A0A9P9IFL1_9PLEO|nr:hypothetical protein B0J11DRAFT_79601 [Dendryphion nanum]